MISLARTITGASKPQLPSYHHIASALTRAMPSPIGRLLALSLCQIGAWGTIYYSLTVLMGPMSADLGWDHSSIIAPFSMALLISGLCAPVVGEAIQRFGSRRITVIGSTVVAGCFVVLSNVTDYKYYVATWVVIGLCMETVFFQPLFAALVAQSKADPRKSITFVTLLTSLSGSLFLTLSGVAVAALDWRNALLACAGIHVFAALTYGICLRGEKREHHERIVVDRPTRAPSGAVRAFADYRFWFLAIAFSTTGLTSAALAVNILPIFTSAGISQAEAITLCALSGPVQFLVRLLLILFESALKIRRLGVIAFVFEGAALVCLSLASVSAWFAGTFSVFHGVSSGLMLIAQAGSIREVFGRANFARFQGYLMGPAIVSRAAGPLVIALLVTAGWSYSLQSLVLGITSLASCLMFYCATRTQIRDPLEKES